MTTSGSLYSNGQPLREIVAQEIRSRIITGVYLSGTRLVERDLATEFDVSRSPVREAIRILNQEGFVETLSTRGIVVKKLSQREVEELFDIREALEGLASRLAAERVAEGAASNLSRFVGASREAVTSKDLDTAHDANSAFHDEIISLSGNRNLQLVLTPLIGRLHWIFRQVSDFDQVYLEHGILSAAIESGDPRKAAAEAQKHVLSYRARTMEYLFG